MNKTKTKALWKALLACTCEDEKYDPYTSVVVRDKIVYSTNAYVLHRVEGLFQPGSSFKALFSHSCKYADRALTFDRVLSYNPCNSDFGNLCDFYDPVHIALALRPHKAIGSKNLRFFSGSGEKFAPLILTSSIDDCGSFITITTAIQGLRRFK